jgi:hypothetical protein
MKTYGDPSNGMTKLYAQLLATKLNILSEADDTDVADAIVDADEFIAAHSWTEWDTFDRQTQKMVLKLKNKFDKYNNGEIGPGHCDDVIIDD